MDRKEINVLIVSGTEYIQRILSQISIENSSKLIINFQTSPSLEPIHKAMFDLILIDNENVDQSIHYIKEVRQYPSLANTLILIGVEQNEIEYLDQFIEAGISDYILKPYVEQMLVLRVKNNLNYVDAVKLSKQKELQFDALLNNTPYMAWFKNKNSEYITVNREFREHSGKDDQTIYGQSDYFVWDGQIGEKCREYDLTVMNERRQIVFDEVIPGRKGYREFNIYKAPVIDELDQVVGTIGIARDVTELRNKDAKLKMILESIPFAVALKDMNGALVDANDKFFEFYNLPNQTLINIHSYYEKYPEFFDEIQEAYQAIQKEDELVLRDKQTHLFTHKIIRDNQERTIEVYKSPVFDISNQVIGIVMLIRDITDSLKTQERIKKLAYTDFLTNLENRRSLYKYIEEDLKENVTDLTVMFIDLDNFKKLNDSCGHHYGDEALILISKKLKALCEDAFVARIGGDEFVVVWKNLTDSEWLSKKIDQILHDMKTEFNKGDKTNIISVSIGVVTSKADNLHVDTLLLKGDLALYKAKEKGKNQYVLYTEDLEESRLYALRLEQALRTAVKHDEFELYYQPQYTPQKELKGFEALFRWDNEAYRGISISEIIKMIEESRMIDEVSECIIKKAFNFAKKINQNREKTIVVSVNISALQIMNHNFVDKFKAFMNEVGVLPEQIGIEITETVLMENIEENRKKVQELKELGVMISLDDFGTGYSSLNYLMHLPLSKVKLDRSFIKRLTDSEESVTLVKLIIDLAHSLSLPVVAEGVEVIEELKLLEQMNVDYIQGYYFSKPLCETEALKLL